ADMSGSAFAAQIDHWTPFRQSQIPAVIPFENRRSPEPWDRPCDGAPEQASNWLKRAAERRYRSGAMRQLYARKVSPPAFDARVRRGGNGAWERERATGEVLRVIIFSAGQFEPIFRAMRENAVRIWGAIFGVLFWRGGDAFRQRAIHTPPPAYVEEHRRAPLV